MSDQDEGADGSSLETCAPMEWAAGGASADEQYILRLQRRMRACALRGPDLLPLFGMKRASLSRLLADARNTFSRERTLETVRIPNASPSSRLHVLGDLHGDVFSFFKALEICGTPSDDNRLVIAGDLVDRGCFGVELLICVLALKVWRPTAVTVIRGNHESTSLMERYGFEAECTRKYDLKIYRAFIATLRELPLAVIAQRLQPPAAPFAGDVEGASDSGGRGLRTRSRNARPRCDDRVEPWAKELQPGERRILIVHGGLWRQRSPGQPTAMTLGTLRQLSCERRQVDDPENSACEDVLWSDPSGDATESGVRHNTLRGAGVFYGAGAVDAFLKRERLCMICRAHEGPDARMQRPAMNSMSQGYSVDIEAPSGVVITLFSAANYCRHGNKGCVATFLGRRASSSELPTFTTYDSDKPLDAALFYDPAADRERPATPR